MEQLKQYDQLIFDLGGVLIDIDYQATEKAFTEIGMNDFKTNYSQLHQSELFDKIETGHVSPQHFINKLLDFCIVGTSPNKVVAAWNAMLGEFPKRKIEILLELKELMPIYLLSNTNEIHMARVYEAWNKVSTIPMDQIFTEVFLSYEIGKRKPDVSTFNWVCEKLQIEPSKTLFLEDSPQNIEGAKNAGLQTFYYQNAVDFYALFS